MSDDLRDFLSELRENYRDSYWWADHPTLRIMIISAAAGMIGLAFHYAELRMDRSMTIGAQQP